MKVGLPPKVHPWPSTAIVPETMTDVLRLKEIAAEGELLFPATSAKSRFDNVH